MKLLKVAKREYLDRVRRKSFLVGAILGPVLMGGFILVPGLLFEHAAEGPVTMAVVDLSDSLFAGFERTLTDTLPDGSRMFTLRKAEATPADLEAVKKRLNAEVTTGVIDGYLVLPKNVVTEGKAAYFGKKVSNIRTLERIESALNKTVIARRLAAQGLDYVQVTDMLKQTKIETVQVGKGGEQAKEFERVYITSMIFVMLLYMTILLWGMAVQRSIIEEKNNRVIEVLLSSLRPFDLMGGKILGVGAAGLTQYAIWGLLVTGLSSYALSAGLSQYVGLSWTIILYFILFYVLGYLFYSTLFAAIGAVCNTDQEAQQFQTPVTMCLALTVVMPMLVMQNPEGGVSTVLSMIPLFSPTLMFMRINYLMPPAWQIALSIAILIASIYIVGLASAKVFRIGILMYGKRPDVREILKWVRRA